MVLAGKRLSTLFFNLGWMVVASFQLSLCSQYVHALQFQRVGCVKRSKPINNVCFQDKLDKNCCDTYNSNMPETIELQAKHGNNTAI